MDNTGGRVTQEDIVPGAIKPRHLAVATSQENGDFFYSDGTNFTRVAIGTANQVLTVVSGIPTWQTSSTPSYTWSSWSPSLTWDGTPPSVVVTSSFKYLTIGHIVFYKAKVEYTNAGVGNTTVNFDAPVSPAIGQASEYNVPGAGNISTAIGGTSPSTAMKYVYVYGTTSAQIYVVSSASIAAKTFWCSGFYEI